MQRSRAIWLGAGAFFLAASLLMACVIGRAGVERGLVRPPELVMDLGALRLLALETDTANCWRPIRGRAGALCSVGSVYTTSRYYIGWLELRRGGTPRRGSIYYKLFVIRLPNT